MFVNIKDVKVGTRLVADGGFTCMKRGAVKVVSAHHDGSLYVPCAEGDHNLDGQIDDNNGTIIGLSIAD